MYPVLDYISHIPSKPSSVIRHLVHQHLPTIAGTASAIQLQSAEVRARELKDSWKERSLLNNPPPPQEEKDIYMLVPGPQAKIKKSKSRFSSPLVGEHDTHSSHRSSTARAQVQGDDRNQR